MNTLDEANIFIEQLEESLKITRNEMERDKKKYSQQLVFMENENADLQKKLFDRNEKYFDDKKKFNAHIRQLESEILVLKNSSSLSSTPEVPHWNNDDAVKWDNKYREIERAMLLKSKEVARLVETNVKLENTISTLKNQLSCSSSRTNVDSDIELKLLLKENNKMQDTIRKLKAHETSILSAQKNQQQLENEVSFYKMKVKTLQNSIVSLQSVESLHQAAVLEKHNLIKAFGDILNVKDRDISVEDIVNAYGALQAKYISALNDAAELKCEIATLGASTSNKDALAYASSSKDATRRLEEKVLLLQQQVELYNGENKRLRSCIISYDEECEMLVRKFNRMRSEGPVVNMIAPDLLALKNAVIEELQAEVDSHRQVVADVVAKKDDQSEVIVACNSTKKRKLEVDGCVSNVDNDAANELGAVLQERDLLIADLKQNESQLQQELYVFHKAVGSDVILPLPSQDKEQFPGACSNTRVLHMICNPYDQAKGSGPKASPYLSRMIELKKLRKAEASEAQARQDFNPIAAVGEASNVNSASSKGGIVDAEGGCFAMSNSMLLDSSMINRSSGGYDADKHNSRLKAVFREKIAQFREAIYVLMGYKVSECM